MKYRVGEWKSELLEVEAATPIEAALKYAADKPEHADLFVQEVSEFNTGAAYVAGPISRLDVEKARRPKVILL